VRKKARDFAGFVSSLRDAIGIPVKVLSINVSPLLTLPQAAKEKSQSAVIIKAISLYIITCQ